LRLAVEVAGGDVPVLAFAAIHRKFYSMAVSAMKSFVTVQDCLYEVLARRNVAEIANWVAVGGVVDGDNLPGRQLVDIDTEDHLRFRREADLHARLGAGVVRKQQQNAAIERLRATLFGKRHREFWRRSARRLGKNKQCGASHGE